MEDQITLQSEQVPEAVEEMLLELVLQRQQGVEGAVPALQLEGLDLDAGVLGGGALGVGEEGRGEAAALAVAGEEGGEPVGEGVLGGGPGEAVENEHEDAVGQGSEPLREAELVPEAAQGAAILPDGFAEVDVFIGAAARSGADDHGKHSLL